MTDTMTYASAGVDYNGLDVYKRIAQAAALTTNGNLERFGFHTLDWSRGESAFIIKTPWGEAHLAFVIEGLGTKAKVADDMSREIDAFELKGVHTHVPHSAGRSYYDNLAMCNAAMVLNDLATSGAQPLVFNQYAGVGSAHWFGQAHRARDIASGTVDACNIAHCVWGGGETPVLRDIIAQEACELAGAAFGFINEERHVINPANIRAGDDIVFVESSGIHANGLTLARKVAERLSEGFLTRLPNGRTFGEMLLQPTYIYSSLITACQKASVDIHYAVNVTGHGWRKLMRAPQPFSYRILRMPSELPIFPFIGNQGGIATEEMYATFNMGVGFALYVASTDAPKVVACARDLGFTAFSAGRIEESQEKEVVIEPLGITFTSESLNIR